MEKSLKPSKNGRVERVEQIPGGRALETVKLHQVQVSAHENIVRIPLVTEGNPPKDLGKIHTTISEKIKVLLRKTSDLHRPVFNFEISTETAKENFKLLKDNNFNLETLLNDKPSITAYGSEFKSVEDLEDLIQDHPHWGDLKQLLKEGVNFPLNELPEEIQLK